MRRVAITQRVEIVESYKERRDCLDQKWVELLWRANITPVIIPNQIKIASYILKNESIDGIILTGGNDLIEYGGNAPERDLTEKICLEYAIEHNIPVLGVCRGMQFIQNYFDIPLKRIKGHVVKKQEIYINGKKEIANSFHNFGTISSNEEFKVWAIAEDGVIKAIRHHEKPMWGIMWHPERLEPFYQRDIKFIGDIFNNKEGD